ncbi:MAG: WG repeat-containing protein [Ekhidna sp.]
MRYYTFILFFIGSFATLAEEFTVFEKDGYFGIKDEIGNVTVPAVYEKLGWSDGSSEVKNGVIGFRRDKLWGLITARNKALTGQKFYTMEPLSNNYFKASIKGRFSNHLFHGVLDAKGKTIVSFNYFSIQPIGANWLVSAFDGRKQLFGIVSFDNTLIIDTKYASIEEQNNLFIARQHGQKLDTYRTSGQPIQLNLDSIIYQEGWVAFQDGYAGYLSTTGALIHDFEFKTFLSEGEQITPVRFPEWTVYKQDTVFLKWQCDSLTMTAQGTLMAYLNGAHHLLLKNSTLLNNHQLVLKEASQNQMIVQNSKTRKWIILKEDGSNVTSTYDSIFSLGSHYACLDEKGWHLLNREGMTINRLPLQSLKLGLTGQFVAKKNNHWGIIDTDQDNATTYKYDSIVPARNEYLVSYLNRWGVLNDKEEWVVRSEFNEVIAVNDLIIGRRGKGYTVHHNGEALYKTIAKPISKIDSHVLVQNDSSKYGLIDSFGNMIVSPEYDSIRSFEGYYELRKDDVISLMTSSGKLIVRAEEAYQEIGGFGEGYFAVKKESRWGFVDDFGRLRISNRYDHVRPFSEGRAAIKLRGKWGFIDKHESLMIQPYYQEVMPFKNGRTIVEADGKFGLVDKAGKEVLELIWKSIHRLRTDNYIVQDMDGRKGLVDEVGSFIFRPAFDHLEDFGNRVLVSKNGAWGVLSYSGNPIFKINHDEIKVMGEFTMVKN